MPAIHHSNTSSLPQPTTCNFSHFRFSNPKIRAPGTTDKHGSSASVSAEQRSMARKSCDSLNKVSLSARRVWHSHRDHHQLLLFPHQKRRQLCCFSLTYQASNRTCSGSKKEHKCQRGGDTVKCFVIHYTTPLFPGRFGLGWHQVSQSRLFCLASGLSFQQGALCVCSGVLAEHCTRLMEVNSNDFQ